VSRTGRLHQFVPTLDPGAVGSHVLEIQRVLRQAGWESEVFSEHTKPPYDGDARPHTEYGKTYPAHDDDIIVYHIAIGSSVADWLMSRRPKRLVVYSHNITPASWFENWEPGLNYGLAWGRAQLAQLARRCVLGIGVSEYNAGELRTYGFRNTEVVPILVDTDALAASADPARIEQLSGPRAREAGRATTTWVFVGRLAPNKCQHDIVKGFTLYRRVYDPDARLWLVGGSSADKYAEAVARFAEDAGVGDAVTFTGAVSQAELAARYQAADVFVCLSEHEGFLVPLLEAWRNDLPVIAYSAAAVPETLGDAGLLLTDKNPAAVAAAAARLTSDAVLRSALVAAGRRRLEHFSFAHASARMLDLASAIADGAFDRPTVSFSG
jgi:glycosyltransferase involved in cell wall biosynthesis